MPYWSAEDFAYNVGYQPEVDDLERVNCEQAGEICHKQCGLCDHNRPKFLHCKDCHAAAYTAGGNPNSHGSNRSPMPRTYT